MAGNAPARVLKVEKVSDDKYRVTVEFNIMAQNGRGGAQLTRQFTDLRNAVRTSGAEGLAVGESVKVNEPSAPVGFAGVQEQFIAQTVVFRSTGTVPQGARRTRTPRDDLGTIN